MRSKKNDINTSKIVLKVIVAVALVAAISLSVFICFFDPNRPQNWIDFATLLGATLSVYGLFLGFLKLRSVAASNALMEQGVQKALAEVSQVLSVAVIAKATRFPREIHTYLVDEKYELAFHRMTDLKELLIHYKKKSILVELTNDPLYDQSIKDLGAHIITIVDLMAAIKKRKKNAKANFKLTTILEYLEAVATMLHQCETLLKE
jgi:hypothetical protein